MKARPFLALLSMAVATLLLAGCDDSNSPLSDPKGSKPDARLAGAWRQRGDDGEVTYYHIGPVGDRLPNGVMRVVSAAHSKNTELQAPGEWLIFRTVLGDHAYLNMTDGKEQRIKSLEEEGWKSAEGYFILKYKVEGDTLLVWAMDGDAKRQAIESGKVKGLVEKQQSGTKVRFTDTTENLARFVAGAGESLFSKDVLRLERVK